MKTGLLIKADGTIKRVAPKNGTDFSLEELQGFVEGLIEIVDLRNGNILVVNEEGKLTSLECNILATLEARQHHAILQNDVIFGDVLKCASEMVK